METTATFSSRATDKQLNYRIDVTDNVIDHQWDHFLANMPGGHHVQTSLWGQLKASLGWRAIRVIARENNDIIAGLQLLVRPIRLVGSIGYIPKGPVYAKPSCQLSEDLMREALHVVHDHRIRFLVVQPPNNANDYEGELSDLGFHNSPIKAFPVGTTKLELNRSLDDILAGMKSKTRYNIRLGERKGVTVREGTAADIPIIHRLVMTTARRQGFKEYSEDYFREMHRVFQQGGHCRLFIAEYRNEPLSAVLLIAFGDTVLFKKGGWSGRHGACHPNENMHWHAIKWSKEHGYKYYDFEGIDTHCARTLQRGEPLPNSEIDSLTRFKLGFGGKIHLHPTCFELTPNRVLRYARSTMKKPAVAAKINAIVDVLKCR